MNPEINSTVSFKLEEKQEFFALDKLTGQLWFKQGNWNKSRSAHHDLVVTAEKSSGASARMTLDITILPFDDLDSFCKDFMCFFDSITHHTIEDFNENFKQHEIGEVSPKIYGRLCKMFEVTYELLNGELSRYFILLINNI